MKGEDPTPELYAAMDRAGLDATTVYSTRQPMSKIIVQIRTKLAADLKQLIEDRESGPQRIEVREEPDEPM